MQPDHNHERVSGSALSVAGLYYRNFVAIGVGVATAMILNVFTPIEFFRERRIEVFLRGEWRHFVGIALLVADDS